MFENLRLKLSKFKLRQDIIKNQKGINKYTYSVRNNPDKIRHCLNCKHCKKDLFNTNYCTVDTIMFRTNNKYICNKWK